jgi:hypothetical protein
MHRQSARYRGRDLGRGTGWRRAATPRPHLDRSGHGRAERRTGHPRRGGLSAPPAHVGRGGLRPPPTSPGREARSPHVCFSLHDRRRADDAVDRADGAGSRLRRHATAAPRAGSACQYAGAGPRGPQTIRGTAGLGLGAGGVCDRAQPRPAVDGQRGPDGRPHLPTLHRGRPLPHLPARDGKRARPRRLQRHVDQPAACPARAARGAALRQRLLGRY